VVTTSDVIDALSLPDTVQIITLDDQALDKQSEHMPTCRTSNDDTAYVIYTSGSTGKPKGCVIAHQAALNTVVDINRRFSVASNDKIMAISSLSFDLSVYDVFGGLAVGATLVMPESQTPDPAIWLSLAIDHEVTIWNSVPALIEMLAEYAEETGKLLPQSLRLALLSGDWIPLSVPPSLITFNPNMEIVSLGGATEASIWSIFHIIGRIEPDWTSIPYGRPLANQTMHVLNAWMEDCPPWVTGEICIGGTGVAKGYHNAPEITAASFVTHPVTGEILYRTGDQGRMRPEGWIEFLGRKDNQVKLRGYRIELGEIEDAIGKTGLVSKGVAHIIGETNENRQLIAFVILDTALENKETFDGELLTALGKRLPRYMVPSQIVHLNELPLTANGKVDRKKLAALGENLGAESVYVPPRNDTEFRLVELWKDLLDLEQVSVFDDFFALGGNSLIASRLIVKIHEIFEIELPFARLFEASNIAKLSEIVIEEVLADIEAMEDA
jgi:amino acid adenylation domain-containing protein